MIMVDDIIFGESYREKSWLKVVSFILTKCSLFLLHELSPQFILTNLRNEKWWSNFRQIFAQFVFLVGKTL